MVYGISLGMVGTISYGLGTTVKKITTSKIEALMQFFPVLLVIFLGKLH